MVDVEEGAAVAATAVVGGGVDGEQTFAVEPEVAVGEGLVRADDQPQGGQHDEQVVHRLLAEEVAALQTNSPWAHLGPWLPSQGLGLPTVLLLGGMSSFWVLILSSLGGHERSSFSLLEK